MIFIFQLIANVRTTRAWFFIKPLIVKFMHNARKSSNHNVHSLKNVIKPQFKKERTIINILWKKLSEGKLTLHAISLIVVIWTDAIQATPIVLLSLQGIWKWCDWVLRFFTLYRYLVYNFCIHEARNEDKLFNRKHLSVWMFEKTTYMCIVITTENKLKSYMHNDKKI